MLPMKTENWKSTQQGRLAVPQFNEAELAGPTVGENP